MSRARHFALIGVLSGVVVAALCLYPQVRADLRGEEIMGTGEMMVVLSLPFSVLTWIGWLIPATDLFGAGDGRIPRWVAYSWVAFTPLLNWGLIGWYLGRRRDRRALIESERAAV